VAHPFTEGICTYTSKSVIKDNYLNSNHKLFIQSIKVGPKEKNSTAYHIPIRLAVALLRDKNGNVNLELPIEGDLNDPNYKVGKVIWQVFKNLIGKAVASPGKLLASKSGVDEKLLTGFSWTPLQSALSEEQQESLDAMVKSLESTPEMKLELINVFNDQREMDALALKAGKKKFLFFHRKVSSEDPALSDEDKLTDQVHDQDSAFNAYLNSQLKADDNLFSVTDKSKKLIGQDKLDTRLQWFYEQRDKALKTYLEGVRKVKPDRYRIALSKEKTDVPYETLSKTVTSFYVEDN
jgi:predicted  nucleic acid-binding Zn-ribbon protein